MKLIVDADCPRSLAGALREAEHSVRDIRDVKPWASDPEIYDLIREEGLILITRDTDFGNILRYPADSHCGIILLRILLMPAEEIPALIRDVIARIPEKDLLGSLTVVRRDRYRTHRF